MLSTLQVGRFVLVRAARLPVQTGCTHVEIAAEMPRIRHIRKQRHVSVRVTSSMV